MTDTQSFTHRHVQSLNRDVFRMGLAANYGIDQQGIREALARGVNYFFYSTRGSAATEPLREALKQNREKYVIATLPLLGWFSGSIRRGVDKALKLLNTDYIDVYQLGWLGVTSAWTESNIQELVKLKESGKVRALGVSIHDRKRAGKLAEDSPLDLLMIRYNAAHPGAETDIFPHLEKRHPAIVAYTATNWRKLLKRPKNWTGPVPSAGDCYRFCLTNNNVDLVLCGPKNFSELNANLEALERGPLSTEEMEWMRSFGKVVHG